MEKQILLNTYVNNLSMDEALQSIDEMIVNKRKSYVVAVNVDVVIKIEDDNYLKQIVDKADLVLVDGKPLIWISKLYKRPVKAKISGSDLIPQLCQRAAERNYSIFLIGGKDGVAEQAKKKLESTYKNINIVGIYSPPFGFECDEKEIELINSKISDVKPDILITCFGCPKQEKWIYENYKKYDSIVSVCAGATIDFLAGTKKRAPKWISNCGFEWLYRFFQEPKRLFKRYFIDDIRIIKLYFKYKKINKRKNEIKK